MELDAALVFQLAVLTVAGLVAGYVNAVAGAGSLLTLPALIFTGLDAAAANATNRVAVLFQNAAALVALKRGGMRFGAGVAWLCVPTAIGGVAGAWVATLLSNESLKLAIAIAMVVFLVASFVPTSRNTGVAGAGAAPPLLETPKVLWTMVPAFVAIGFYAGFLQAGVGVVILLYLSVVHGAPLVGANGLKVAVILVLAAVALATFAVAEQQIDPLRGVVLALSNGVGGYVGARDTLKRGERFVRVVLVVAVVASALKLGWDAL